MWRDMFIQQIPLLEKVLRTALVYLLVLILIRLSGKRGLATTNTLDFVVVFLLANGVQNAIIGPDNSVTGGVVSAITLVVINTGMRYLANINPAAVRIIQGMPTTVVEDGHFDEHGLKRLGLRRSELEHAIRSQHGDSINEIQHGELTPSGEIVLTLKHSEQSATKADVAALTEQLRQIERLLTVPR